TDQTQVLSPTGSGVFAFRADGTPLQLVTSKDRRSLILHDLAKAEVLRTFASPIDGASTIVAWALTTDGSNVGASISTPDDSGLFAVWEATSGRLVRTIPARRPRDVALSPDARLLAGGDEDGGIILCPLPQGEPVTTLKGSRNPINCLLFGPDPLRRRGEQTAAVGWLLAAGDAGGTVTIWDLQDRTIRSHCRGSGHGIYALAFCPNGMNLASAGRGRVKIWDIGTGRPVLELGEDMDLALAFPPDGTRLAAGRVRNFGSGGGATVWELQYDRGMQILRGL